MPLRPEEWLADRQARLDMRLRELGRAARAGTIPGGSIENGVLHIEKLEAAAPTGAEDLVLDLYKQIPPTRITDLLLEVDAATGFTEAFTHLRTGAPCADRIGLNKGEAHHALKRAISFHRRGEIRDRSAEGQHYRIAGMNLLAAIIIFWNTMKLGEVVANQKRDGKLLSPDLLAHVSPLGWEHINLTGEYRWPKP